MDQSESPDKVWEFRTIRHARLQREPTRYVIDRFLASHTLNIIYGAPGSLKSMITLDMALAVAGGRDWMPVSSGGFAVDSGAVLWVDVDNGRRRTDERVDAMSKKANVSEDVPFYYISMPDPQLIATDLESMGMLMDAALELDAHLIVVDNLGLVTGEVEENSARMAQVMKNFRAIAEATGAAIVLIHHQRKGGAGQSRAGDGLRGHSSIEAALDLSLHVSREANTNLVSLTSSKTRGVDVPPVLAEFWYEHVPGTRDLDSAWFTAVEAVRGTNPVHEFILETVDLYAKITKKKLIDVVYEGLDKKESYRKIRAWVDDMIALSGELIETDGENNAKIISLP